MGKDEKTEQTSPQTVPAVAVTADALANAILTATEAVGGNRRQVKFGSHTPKSAFNPTGKRRNPKRVFYQNGFKANEPVLHDQEIERIETIKPGTFVDGLVTVVIIGKDDEEEKPAVHLKYHCATADQRMNLGSRIQRSKEDVTMLSALLRMCIEEHAAQQEALKAQRRREIEEAMA